MAKDILEILNSDAPAQRLREASREFFSLFPELKPMEGFDQNNRYHIYDLWEHTLHVLEYAAGETSDLRVRLEKKLEETLWMPAPARERSWGGFWMP